LGHILAVADVTGEKEVGAVTPEQRRAERAEPSGPAQVSVRFPAVALTKVAACPLLNRRLQASPD
jgi:hypothetical protein